MCLFMCDSYSANTALFCVSRKEKRKKFVDKINRMNTLNAKANEGGFLQWNFLFQSNKHVRYNGMGRTLQSAGPTEIHRTVFVSASVPCYALNSIEFAMKIRVRKTTED